MRRLFALLLLCALAAPVDAERIGGLAWWRAQLADPRYQVRRQAAERLARRRGAGALLRILAGDADPSVRAQAARALGQVGGPASLELLLRLAFDPDPLVARQAAGGLCRLGELALQRLRAGVPGSAERRAWLIDRVAATLTERRLLDEITRDKGIGSWENKFRGLSRYQPAAVPTLLTLLSRPDGSIHRLERDADQLYRVRELAMMALAELGDGSARVRRVLEAIVADSKQEWHHQGARAALFKLGHPRLLNQRIGELTRLLARAGIQADQRRYWLSQLASCYYTKGKFDSSAGCYRAILRFDPDDSNSSYNLACCHARLGQLDKALAALKRAIDAGFVDLEHMLKDGDLKNVRKDPRFAAQILVHPKLKGRRR